VVIMTASSDTKIQDEIRNSGVKDILKKPYSLEELTELIEKFRKEV
jgi:FixJ family two-component response regulator